MINVIIWGLEESTLTFINRCWRELQEQFNVVAFTQSTRGGGSGTE